MPHWLVRLGSAPVAMWERLSVVSVADLIHRLQMTFADQ